MVTRHRADCPILTRMTVSNPECVAATFARTCGLRRLAHVLANVATLLKPLRINSRRACGRLDRRRLQERFRPTRQLPRNSSSMVRFPTRPRRWATCRNTQCARIRRNVLFDLAECRPTFLPRSTSNSWNSKPKHTQNEAGLQFHFAYFAAFCSKTTSPRKKFGFRGLNRRPQRSQRSPPGWHSQSKAMGVVDERDTLLRHDHALPVGQGVPPNADELGRRRPSFSFLRFLRRRSP